MIDKEYKWRESVEFCKKLLEHKTHNQMLIAERAIEVCEITWGGASKEYDTKFTVSRFAKNIGINRKTLSNWIGIKRNVYDKLTPDLKKRSVYWHLNKVSRMVNKSTLNKEVNQIYKKFVDMNSLDSRILGYLNETRSILFNLKHKSAAISCNDDTLEEVYFYCRKICSVIKKERPKLLAVNHNLISQHSRAVRSSAAKSVSNRNIKISPKDQKIIKYLKRRKEFVSPTEIGMEIGRHNRSSASAWALRTIYKLDAAGLVRRNEKGWYKILSKAKAA